MIRGVGEVVKEATAGLAFGTSREGARAAAGNTSIVDVQLYVHVL
jgi:hypothetical protein